MPGRMAVDIGGTFTDVVLLDAQGDLRTAKVPTTPGDPVAGVLAGVEALLPAGAGELDTFIHGTTVALNAILERRGAVTGLITTRGFRDVLEIMRTNRPHMYDLQQDKPVPFVPRPLRVEVDERLDSQGRVVRPLRPEEAVAAARTLVERGAQAIAICFLFSYLNPAHEEAARDAIRREFPHLPVSISSEVAREWREFERTSTVVLNSYCQPLMAGYVDRLEAALRGRGFRQQVLFMQSNGGVIGAQAVKRMPIKTLLSGPVGGVIAAELVGRLTGRTQILTLDIGGTSADMCLIDGGRALLSAEKQVDGWPVLFAAVDIHAIGAGGGSIARVDPAGGLRVGPESAGSVPGPVAYGRGGTEPTVTDANLVLGYIGGDSFLGGGMRLDREAAEKAIHDRVGVPLGLPVERAAAGIIQVVNARMLTALREVSLHRGYDVRDFVLLPYGGAGGLHATALARELGMAQVIIPPYSGVFSALGMLAADRKVDLSRTWPQPLAEADGRRLAAVWAEMEAEGQRLLAASGAGGPEAGWTVTCLRTADLRYFGQEYTLSVPVPPGPVDPAELGRRFTEAHRHFYGYTLPDAIWLVNLRTVVVAAGPPFTLPRIPPAGRDGAEAARKGSRRIYLPDHGGWTEAAVYDRPRLGAGAQVDGPAVVEDSGATILLLPGDRATVDPYGNLLVDLGGAAGG